MVATATKTAPRTTHSANAEDFRQVVEQSFGRQRGEEVRCIQLYGNCYRCSWWKSDGAASGRITRSRFLRVTKTADGYVIEDLTG